MLLLGLAFSWYSALQQPQEVESSPETSTSDTTNRQSSEKERDTLQGAMPVIALDSLAGDSARLEQLKERMARYGSVATAMQGEECKVVLENNLIRAEFNTRGGMFHRVTLVDGYRRYRDSAQIELWEEESSQMVLKWLTAGKELISTADLYFVPNASYINASTGAATLVMKLPTTIEGRKFELHYTLEPDSYAVDCKVQIEGLELEMDLTTRPLTLQWNVTGWSNEKGLQAERSKCSIYFLPEGDDRDYLSEGGDDEETTEKPVTWVAFKQDFFSAAVISSGGFQTGSQLGIRVLTDSLRTKEFAATLGIPVTQNGSMEAGMTFFFGPNDYKVLRNMDVPQFDRIIDYGWGIIGWVNRFAVRPLFWFLSTFIGSFGLIILIVTLIIKTLLFPVTWKNYLSSAKMRVLKPEMDEINKRFEGKEAAEKQQAIMALYRQTGVNPFAGCIPVLIQMPILYAMFRFFPAEIVLRGESFLWADDLAAYDSIFNLPFTIPFYGAHISGFTLLMAASTFVYTRMSSASQPTMQQPGMPNMKVMMNIFTVMMLFFFNSMPSGLSMYYFTANMISISQMWVIKNYIIDEGAIRAKIEENKKKPRKKSAFQQRLEEAQKAQQKKIEAQRNKKK